MTTGGQYRPAGAVAVSGQFDNHDGFRPSATDALAGRSIRLRSASDGALGVDFIDTERLSLRFEPTDDRPLPATEQRYEALAVRPGIVAVVCRPDDGSHSAFAVLHLDRGQALVAWSQIVADPTVPAAAREQTEYLHATIDGAAAAPFPVSDGLVGKRILYRYSDTHAFEQIYLNPHAYCWHGVEGPERWIGDVDPCITFALDDDLYLFSWSETVVPFNGSVVVDLRAMRSLGRFLGWDSELRSVEQIVVGARATLLNETSHAGL